MFISRNEIISIFLTFLAITLLVISGPVSGIMIRIDTDKKIYSPGETVIFTISVDINSDEALPIDSILLNITGRINSITNCLLPFNITGYEEKNITCIDNLGNNHTLTVTLTTNNLTYGYVNLSAYGFNNETYGFVNPENSTSVTWGFGYGYGNIINQQIIGSSSFNYTVSWRIPRSWPDRIYTTRIALKADGITYWNKVSYRTLRLITSTTVPTTIPRGGRRRVTTTTSTTTTIPREVICGNGLCEVGENCSNCPEDCSCPSGTRCVGGVCRSIPRRRVTPTSTPLVPLGVWIFPIIGIVIFIIYKIYKKKKISKSLSFTSQHIFGPWPR